MLFIPLKYIFLSHRYSGFWNMQISQVMTSQTQPNIDQLWWKNISQPICTRTDWFFAVRFYYVYSTYEYTSFVTMATYWFPDLPDIKSFPGRHWRCILIFANGPSSARCRKHINMLGQVFGLLKCFLNLKSKTKEWVAKGNQIFIAVGMLLVELLLHQVSVVSA